MASGGAIEIVTVDPNADGYDTDSEDEEDSVDDIDDDYDDNDLLNFERQSQCSNATFRSRTDSSSIGDYESHTSDYDDDDDDDDVDDDKDILVNNTCSTQNAFANLANNANNANNSILDLHANLVAPDDLLLDTSYHKSRTISTNTLNSDVDGLGLQIDANNFDLAEFITKDDFQLQNTPSISSQSYVETKPNVLRRNDFNTNIGQAAVVQVIFPKKDDSDSESDVIVDVETVEIDEDDASYLRKAAEILNPGPVPEVQAPVEEESSFVDNVKSDPSWSPKQTVKKVENLKGEVNIY